MPQTTNKEMSWKKEFKNKELLPWLMFLSLLYVAPVPPGSSNSPTTQRDREVVSSPALCSSGLSFEFMPETIILAEIFVVFLSCSTQFWSSILQ
jgi:hypothetical protein